MTNQWQNDHICTVCGYDIVRCNLRWQCENCETVYASLLDYNPVMIDKSEMADMRDLYTLLAEIMIESGVPSGANLYHEAKERAEHYDNLADTAQGSGKWRKE